MFLEGVHIPIPEECFQENTIDMLLNKNKPSIRINCWIENIGVDGRIEMANRKDIEISLKTVTPPIKEKFLLQDNKILQVDTVYLWPTFIVKEVDKLIVLLEAGVKMKEISVQITETKKDVFIKHISKIYTFKRKDFLKIVKWAQVAYCGGMDCQEYVCIPQYEKTAVKRLERVVKLLEKI